MGPDDHQEQPEIEPAGSSGGQPLESSSHRQFEDLRVHYEALAPSLHAWARLRAGDPPLDPDDLLQEVWVRAMEQDSAFDPARGSFRHWVFGIAKLILLEALRKRPVVRGLARTMDSAALRAWPDVATSIQTRMSRDESVQRLLEHVAAIDDLDRKVLIHCGLEGMPCSLASVRLGLSLDAVTKRWQRLRARLRTEGVATLLAE